MKLTNKFAVILSYNLPLNAEKAFILLTIEGISTYIEPKPPLIYNRIQKAFLALFIFYIYWRKQTLRCEIGDARAEINARNDLTSLF